MARDLVTAIRKNLTLDWTVKKSVRAKLRSIVKQLLRKYGYPPNKCEKATVTVLQQAELLCTDWVWVKKEKKTGGLCGTEGLCYGTIVSIIGPNS
ncbi:MAG: DUF3387 domain-containing protein [Trichodesmium sp. St18_bin1]|nr:DUF3387 domain-containing protein [Trichodesmium sp. St18_bin1]MDE5119331.1 DUF3387 domain-containing protein [Trichodesmium sp. St19_bin1]